MVPESENSGFDGIIRDASKRHGWSQAELAENSGLSRPTIARIEAGNDVTTATVAKVAQVLGLKLELKRTGAQAAASEESVDGDGL
ncbi:helix-turn-helix domain-containing protein [Pseudactinotalea sp. HY160]|uniref:helix-turn-helix transcriptional regulator n=1 Tax=Pseudactinotalea sp. HY160 TaxID=2654490 RepID=UPI00128BF614|nr:helix-turn-helix transcriptional regulator [Pseudactinotalea sp. HY160]MPV49465.1 helix-turn-helix domain-containing protein [Pseudactinotalea sp. HY160]